MVHLLPSTAASFLAIDLGASSGRAVVGTLMNTRMHMQEVHRFPTPLVEEQGRLYWDIDRLWAETRASLARGLDVAPELRSVSVDSWAVDYVSLDGEGNALGHPFAYRDTRTAGKLARVLQVMPADDLYRLTGTQFLPFNTLSQIVADMDDNPALVQRTQSRLCIADYLLYRLSGRMVAEETMASTTQLFNVSTRSWATGLIDAIGDDSARYPQTVGPGTVLSAVTNDALSERHTHRPTVIATCSHDTGAAVAAAPATGREPWAYISSGTWSLVGAELPAPVLTREARLAGFTNELGIDGTIRFLKNRNGLWVLEECAREWSRSGERPSWDTLSAEAHASHPPGTVIDLNAPEFAERGHMAHKINMACDAAGARQPASRGETVRLVLESLAHSYSRVLEELEDLTGVRPAVVHVFGGGARNHLLNQLTANACGRRVVAGPDEATVLGNLLLQARTLGALPEGASLRDIARHSAGLVEFTPRRAQSERTAALSAL